MSKYIRIKKSKNLRYKLISILYLLFISLSVLQIPIDWLRVNPVINRVFAAVEVTEQKMTLVEKAKAEVLALEEQYIAQMGTDSETGLLLQPENFTFTDQFMLKEQKAYPLFEALKALNDSLMGGAVEEGLRTRYEALFAGDLAHGLAENKAAEWSAWKFEHVPGTVVRTLLKDLFLRLNLLNGEFQLKGEVKTAAINLVVDYNLEHLKVGDTAFFVLVGTSNLQIDSTSLRKGSFNIEQKGDSLMFMPLLSGAFRPRFTLGEEERVFRFDVAPASFRRGFTSGLGSYYAGLAFYLPAELIPSGVPLRSAAEISREGDAYRVLATDTGWCTIEASKAGRLVFKDSIFIQSLPQAQVYAAGASGGRLSRQVLKEQGLALNISLFGLDSEIDYTPLEADLLIFGRDSTYRRTYRGQIQLDSADWQAAQIIQLERLLVSSPAGTQTISKALTIKISGND